MAKGSIYPSESITFSDKQTGAAVRQVTRHPSVHHHPFYYIPAYDDAMERLYFISHRTGRPEIFAEARESGKLLQLTARADIREWSIHPAHNGRYIYFVAGNGGWRVDTETLIEEELCNFGDTGVKADGMVGAGMGTTTVSRDDRYWAVPVKIRKDLYRFSIIDTDTGEQSVILERDSIGHPEFHPDDNMQLRYAGPYTDRIWTIRRDGSDHRLVYERNTEKKEWIVHETWRPGTREILTTQWPFGVLRIDADTGNVCRVCSFNAWHAMINRAGTQMVTDTTFPDVGLQLFDVMDTVSEPHPLCLSESSNAGGHWNTDHCPYDDGPIEVYAPQHTHPHPNFSPDGHQVVFTSDRTGYAQVYEVTLQPEVSENLPHL